MVMTPCEERGWKVGDRFRVVGDGHLLFDKGEVVTLARDDSGNYPHFCGVDPDDRAFVHINDVEPITPNWTGPADGLPTVGVECEHFATASWERCTIKAHVQSCGATCAVVQLDDRWNCTNDAERFRPIKSDRERAIDEIANEVLFRWTEKASAKDLAEHLYDEGYRKTEAES